MRPARRSAVVGELVRAGIGHQHRQSPTSFGARSRRRRSGFRRDPVRRNHGRPCRNHRHAEDHQPAPGRDRVGHRTPAASRGCAAPPRASRRWVRGCDPSATNMGSARCLGSRMFKRPDVASPGQAQPAPPREPLQQNLRYRRQLSLRGGGAPSARSQARMLGQRVDQWAHCGGLGCTSTRRLNSGRLRRAWDPCATMVRACGLPDADRVAPWNWRWKQTASKPLV